MENLQHIENFEGTCSAEKLKDIHLHFHPEHWSDLNRSGLNNEMITRAGVHSVRPGDIKRKLGDRLASKVNSLLAFPYNDGSDFERYKVFPTLSDKRGHKIKYLQREGSKPHLYFTEGAEKVLDDTSIPLWILEGEKKTLRWAQEGYPSVGIGGVYNWKPKDANGLIADFDRINLVDRTVYLVGDSDFHTNSNVRLAYYRLTGELMRRGATVYLITIPTGDHAAKQGLDDFLLANTKEDFLDLPQILVTPEELRKIGHPYLDLLIDEIEDEIKLKSEEPYEASVSDYVFVDRLIEKYKEILGHEAHTCKKSPIHKLLVPKEGEFGSARPHFEKIWNCPRCVTYLGPREVKAIYSNFPKGFYYLIIPYNGKDTKRYDALLKKMSRSGSKKFYAAVSFKECVMLVISDVRVEDMQFISWRDMEMGSLLLCFINVEPKPLKNCKKIRHSRNFVREEKNMKRGRDEFYTFSVGGDWDEVAEGLRAIGCNVGERKGEDSPVSIRYSELALNYFRSLALGDNKICPLPLPFDHPLWHLKVNSQKRFV